MEKPKHGKLIHQNEQWSFQPGTKSTNPSIPLPEFATTFHDLIATHQITCGHPNFAKIIKAKENYEFSNLVARHVSAKGLSSHDVPTLINHKNLPENDRQIWHNAYKEEYDG